MQQWRESFSKEVNLQTGDWNTFAGKFTQHTEEKIAIEQFNQLFVKEYIIIAGDNLTSQCQCHSIPSYDDFMKVINSQ